MPLVMFGEDCRGIKINEPEKQKFRGYDSRHQAELAEPGAKELTFSSSGFPMEGSLVHPRDKGVGEGRVNTMIGLMMTEFCDVRFCQF